MKKLIFILLKIVEVVLAFAFVWFVLYKPFIWDFVNWLENIIGWGWVMVINNVILFWCLFNLIRHGHFKAWLSANKKWSQNIVNWLKRVKEQ